MNSFAAVTICSVNYIGKALVLVDSYAKHHPNHNVYLVIVDRKNNEISIDRPKLNIIWAEDLGIPNFLQHAFMFDVIEFNTNVKPSAMKLLLQKHDVVLYLDPDIKVYAPLTPVFDALESGASLVVTPHSNTPILDGHKPDDLDLLKFGAFNLGFIGVKRCDEAFNFLNWWSERCLSYGFYEPQLGLGVDQKWVGLAPCYFPNMKVLHDYGLNVAFWNLHERTLLEREGSWFVNETTILRFFHFSSFNEKVPDEIAKKQTRFMPGSRPDFSQLAREYAAELKTNASGFFSSHRYTFDFFDDGAYVTPALRRFYSALKLTHFANESNPFSNDGLVKKFANTHRLVGAKNLGFHRHIFSDASAYGWQMSVINKVLRILLFLIGPERYFNLMRYLAHISSLRNQANIFGKTESKKDS